MIPDTPAKLIAQSQRLPRCYMKIPKYVRSFEVILDLPETLLPLLELARNYYWTWNHSIRDLFRDIDRNAWMVTERNPLALLHSLDRERIDELASDRSFLEHLNEAVVSLRAYMNSPTWFDATYPGERDTTQIAYFCAEFGITESLPIYSGGLGILAGDHLKAASDLGLPLVGVGLLYNRGYFRQRLNFDGWQQEVYPQNDAFQLPITMLRDSEGRPVRVEIEFPDRTVHCQLWKATVGRVDLYLLDSNVMENQPADQGITDNLYGGDEDMRIRQEMILGIGGMKALATLGIKPTVCHMNEGHAGFLSLERIRQYMDEHGCDFHTARQVIMVGNVFTTHTVVAAAFDLFEPPLLQKYLGKTIASTGLSMAEFIRLGRTDPNNEGEAFNMAYFAMSMAGRVNGVAKLHAEVTREMFSDRWPNYPAADVPVTAVTNGIHTQTWVGRRMAALFDRYLGEEWREHPENPDLWEKVDEIPDDDLWSTIENKRGDLVRFARRRYQRDIERRTQNQPDFATLNSILDPRILTIGFARRFATYKRATLMIADRNRLKQLLFHPDRPIQILIAGKSHPRDDAGKKLIQELVQYIEQEGVQSRMLFLEDYDMFVARQLVQGVDVWLNNPRRPFEASGTSGMKVVPNGGLNCSILDGWWDEGYDPEVGWAIGGREKDADPGRQDWIQSRELYELIERKIAPTFYERSQAGVPEAWVGMVRNSIKSLGPRFSTGRMVAEYAREAYIPSSRDFVGMSSDGNTTSSDALAWTRSIRETWSGVRVMSVSDNARLTNSADTPVEICARVFPGAVSVDDLKVELVVGRPGQYRELHDRTAIPMQLDGKDGDQLLYRASLRGLRSGQVGYTVRVRPQHAHVPVDADIRLMTWLQE